MTAPETEYRPREFWRERLSAQFDLRGTGHPGLSGAYNERCYRLRGFALDQLLARHKVPVAGREVLDAGCGTGFFVEHFLERGAHVTGVDLTDVAVERLSARHPNARFEVGDLSEWRASRTYDLVSCFDVLFHIVDPVLWDRALTNLTDAVAPGGWFVFTEYFPLKVPRTLAAHNVARTWQEYETALIARGLVIHDQRPTHHLMNRELGLLRFLNRFPELLYRVDLTLMATGLLNEDGRNRIVLAQRPAS